MLYPHNKEAVRKVTDAFRTGDRAAVVHATGTGKSFIIEAVAAGYSRVAVIAPNAYVLAEVRKRDIRADFLTYPAVMAMKAYPEDQYDLIVLDEFHRAGAQVWGTGVAALLAANPGAKVFGTTATEIRYLDGARNMADELFEGNVVSRLPLTEAWLRDILPVPKYVVGLYDYEDVYEDYMRRLKANRRLSESDFKQAAEALGKGRFRWETSHGVSDILRKHLPQDTRRMIVFCDRTESLEETRYRFVQWMMKAGFRCATYSVHYRNPEREQELLDFERDDEKETGVKVLFAIDMLNEGVHVPDVDAVVMLRQTASKLILLQQMGRCMSVGRGRQSVIFDLVDNLTSTSEVERIREEYDCLCRNAAVNDPGREVKEFTIVDYVKDIRDLIYKVNAFRPSRDFPENVELLRHYVMEVGRWPKNNSDNRDERSVAAFAFHHREDREVADLRRYAEDNLGIGPWRTKTPFEKSYQALSDFLSRERRWPVARTDDPEEKKLYVFAYNHLRSKYSGKLDSFREMAVREYGCDILFEESREKVDTGELARELEEFVRANGRWPSFSSEDRKESLLNQRANARKNTSEIAAVRRMAGDEYGITFRKQRLPKEESAALLESFVEKNGRWPVRNGKDQEESYLATVAYSLREDPAVKAIAQRHGIILSYRSIPRKTFDDEFARLEAFVNEHRRWPIAGKNGNNPDREERDLHRFAARHNKDPRIANLLERAQKEYGFDYNFRYDTVQALSWTEAFIKEHGRWPSSSSPDKEQSGIASFLSRLKKKDPERFAAFEEVMSHLAVKQQRKVFSFEQKLARLRKFVETTGRWPRQDQPDPLENSVARFASKNYTAPEVVALREKVDETFRKKPGERLEDLRGFIASTGRWPSVSTPDPKEKSLAAWCKSHGENQELAAIREAFGKDSVMRAEKEFLQKVSELASYVKKTGRWPSMHVENKEEKAWAYFIRCNRTREEIVSLKRNFRMQSSVSIQASYEVRLEELRQFCLEKHRLPLWNAPDDFEKGLYYFYVSKKNRPRYKEDIARAVAWNG